MARRRTLTPADQRWIEELISASVQAAVTAAQRGLAPSIETLEGTISSPIVGNTVDVEPVTQPGDIITCTCTDPDMAEGDRTVIVFLAGGPVYAIGRIPGAAPPL